MDNRNLMQGLLVRIALGVFGLLTAATLFLALFNDKGALQVRGESQRLSGIQSEIATIEAENLQLTDEIKSLRTDPGAIEKLAREELKLVKPDEIVLVTPQ